MLKLVIPGGEQYDEVNDLFIATKEQTLQLEHSLVSLRKWESKWRRSFISKPPSTVEESIDYIRCMTLTQNVNPDVYNFITNEHIKKVNEYIDAPMTATTISKNQKAPNRRVITAEIIYYWMIRHNIPFECQKWHLNQLMTLINVCNIEEAPPKKMSNRELLSRNRSLNASRRNSMRTRG